MKRIGSVLAAALALVGCESAQRLAWQSGIPGIPGAFQVESVERRADTWLDVQLVSGNLRRRVFALADDPACAGMLVQGGDITWARTEPFGPLSKDGQRCRVVGLGDLETWRNARSRRAGTPGPIRTARTRFSVLHQDELFTYAQGGFSLAGFLGWAPGTDQVVALLPRNEVCDTAPPNTLITMEYRVQGRPAFSLVTRSGLCPIEAVIATPPAVPSATPAAAPDAAPAD
jgi:hypothetical protein